MSNSSCEHCGQWFASHNDDGSCVNDQLLSVRETLRRFFLDYDFAFIHSPVIGISEDFAVEVVDSPKQDMPYLSAQGQGMARIAARFMGVDVDANSVSETIRVAIRWRKESYLKGEFDAHVTVGPDDDDRVFDRAFNWGRLLARDVKNVELAVHKDDPAQITAAVMAGLKMGGVNVWVKHPSRIVSISSQK